MRQLNAQRSSMPRRGFSLPELIVAMVLFAIIGGAIVKTLSTGQRAYDAQVQHVEMQQNMRMAANFLTSELRELNASDGDIQSMSSDSIRIRSMRQMGFVCTLPTLGGALVSQVLSGVTFYVRDPIQAGRYFAPGDSLLVFYEGNPSVRADDSWLVGAFAPGTDPNTAQNANCQDVPARQGRLFTTNLVFDASALPPQVNAANAITLGSPIRAFQSVVYKRLQVGNDWYVGFDSAGVATTNQPLIGPLADANGMSFTYYDSLNAVLVGNTPAIRNRVARISIALALKTAKAVRKNTGTPAADTSRVVLEVALRNNRRF